MSESRIEKLVADVASALVFADWTDPESWQELPAQFEALAEALAAADRTVEAGQAASAAAWVRALAAGDGDPDTVRVQLTRITNALQACVHGDCGPDDADWPAEAPATSAAPAAPAPTKAPAKAPAKAATARPAPVEADTGLVDETIMAEFLARQADVMDDIEKELLTIDSGVSQGDREGINRFFHTLKGESALLGLNEVSELCHATEDMIQARDLASCIDQLLEVKDWFIATFRHLSGMGPEPGPVADMMALVRQVGAAPAAAAGPGPAPT
ncbi:Hpt domain-containing protein, partial [bacterium]|nr:Hpt domain-containing protein [bacterium]